MNATPSTPQLVKHSAEELQRLIASKNELYEAAIRNGFYLPKIKSSLITEQYINDVVCGKLHCPKFEEVRLKPCPRPPDKATLLRHVTNVNKKHIGKPLGIDENHTPDKAWLLVYLSTYAGGLDIFKKSYVAPPRQEKFVAKIKVDLPEDFLKDLPASRKKGKHRRLGILAQGREEAKSERLKHLQEKFKKEYLKQKNKLDALKHSDSNRREATQSHQASA